MPTLFQLGDIGPARRDFKHISTVIRALCRCGRPARRRGLTTRRSHIKRPVNASRRGDYPRLCEDCHIQSLRRTWREAKRRHTRQRSVA